MCLVDALGAVSTPLLSGFGAPYSGESRVGERTGIESRVAAPEACPQEYGCSRHSHDQPDPGDDHRSCMATNRVGRTVGMSVDAGVRRRKPIVVYRVFPSLKAIVDVATLGQRKTRR